MVKHKGKYALPAAALMLGLGAVAPISAWAEGESGDETSQSSTCTAESTGSCEASDWASLSAGLNNKSISAITLVDDINTDQRIVYNRGITINGNKHKITSTASGMGMSVTTSEAITLNDLNFDITSAGAKGIQIYAKDLTGYNLTLNHTSLRSNGYGIINYAEYYGAESGTLNIVNNSKIEWIDTEGNPVANKVTDVAGNTTLANGYSYGLVDYGMKEGSVWNIEGSEISGYRYAAQFSQNAAGGELNIIGSYLNASRSDIDTFATATEDARFTINVKDSKLHGINLYGGNSENYANVLFEKSASYTDMVFEDVAFTVYENETALNNYFANQYAITNRAAGTANTNTAVFRGESSYIVLPEYLAAKVQFTNFMEEPFWADKDTEDAYENKDITFAQYADVIRGMDREEQVALRSTENGLTRWYGDKTPANSGITVEGGTYSYNPIEFVAEGLDVYKNEDGLYVVDNKATINAPDKILLEVGKTYDLSGALDETALKYATLESDGEILTNDGMTIEALKAGDISVNLVLHNYREPVSVVIRVIAYEVNNDAAAIHTVFKSVLVGENDLGANVLAALKAAASGKIAGYYNVDLKLVGENGQAVGELSEVSEPVLVTVALPEGLAEVEDGATRSYAVLRYHDGEGVASIEAIDNGDGTISFRSDKFSTFAVTYSDRASGDSSAADSESTSTDAEASSASPETGRMTAMGASAASAGMMAAAAVAVIGAIAGIAMLMRRK